MTTMYGAKRTKTHYEAEAWPDSDLDEAALKRSPPEDQGQPRHPAGVEGRFWPSLHPHTHSPHPRLEASGAMRVLASSPQADPARPEAPSTSLFFSGGLITVG